MSVADDLNKWQAALYPATQMARQLLSFYAITVVLLPSELQL